MGITVGGANGHFELNVYKPMIASSLLHVSCWTLCLNNESALFFSLYASPFIYVPRRAVIQPLEYILSLNAGIVVSGGLILGKASNYWFRWAT